MFKYPVLVVHTYDKRPAAAVLRVSRQAGERDKKVYSVAAAAAAVAAPAAARMCFVLALDVCCPIY